LTVGVTSRQLRSPQIKVHHRLLLSFASIPMAVPVPMPMAL